MFGFTPTLLYPYRTNGSTMRVSAGRALGCAGVSRVEQIEAFGVLTAHPSPVGGSPDTKKPTLGWAVGRAEPKKGSAGGVQIFSALPHLHQFSVSKSSAIKVPDGTKYLV